MSLPIENYVYRRCDTGRTIVIPMTLSERLARELVPGRLLLDDGTPADRDLEAEAQTAPRGTLDLVHLAKLRAQLESLGS